MEYPRVSITYSGELIQRYQTRSAVLGDGSTSTMESYPVAWSMNDQEEIMPYGLVLLFAGREHDGIMIAWGVKSSSEGPGMQLGFEGPDGCRSEQALPFCRIFRTGPGELEAKLFIYLDGSKGDSYDLRWLLGSLRWVLGDPDRDSGTTWPPSSTDSLTFKDRNGDLIRTEVEIKTQEFLGLASFGISVSMQEIEGPSLNLADERTISLSLLTMLRRARRPR